MRAIILLLILIPALALADVTLAPGALGQIQDGISFLADLWKLFQAHPKTFGSFAGAGGLEVLLPLLPWIKANGCMQLAWNIGKWILDRVKPA